MHLCLQLIHTIVLSLHAPNGKVLACFQDKLDIIGGKVVD